MGQRILMRSPTRMLSILLVILEITQATGLAPNQTRPRVPAVILFGDSIVDPGNNNAIQTVVKCNFPPYGMDFPGHLPTGRFSNGKIPSDFIGSQLGIKEYVPAYLGAGLDAQELLTGVSFASGGTGYDPLTPQIVSAISMSDQLKMFKEYQEKLKEIAGVKRAANIIAKSAYIVVTGTDDIANTYFTTPFRRAEYNLPSYINFVVQHAVIFLKNLYHLGARKIAVVGVPPVGCVPSQRTLAGGFQRVCVSHYNQAAQMFNSRLSTELQRLNSTLQKSKIVYIDIYTSLLDLIMHPSKYGFEESSKGCCGTGYFEVTLTCNSLTASTCQDASKYVFWDSYHPTEKAYELLSKQVFQQYGPWLN